jgi:hypothetical protein
MVIPELKYYCCAKCKLEMIPESETRGETAITASGVLTMIRVHKKCGHAVSEFDWRKY